MCCMWLAGNTGRKNYAKKSPSVHHRTSLSSYIFATKVYIRQLEKPVKHQYFLQIFLQHGTLRPTNSWDQLASLGHPSKFQRGLRLGFIAAATSLNGSQPNFARCLAVFWTGRLHFLGLLPRKGILPRAKFTLHPSLAFYYIGSVTTRHSSSRHQPKFPASYKEWNYGHLYSAGWPSHWVSAHILVSISSAGGDASSWQPVIQHH